MKTTLIVLLIALDLVFAFKLEQLEKVLLRHIDVEALQNVFKVHLFRNPHPNCALLDESCNFDNECCQGMECKMNVDRAGLQSVCLSKVYDPQETPVEDDDNANDDIGWTFTKHDNEVESLNKEILHDAIQASLKGMKEKEQQILNNDLNLIQELRKPLTFEELRELRQLKVLEELKRQQKLKELKEWTKNHKINELTKKQRLQVLEKLAKERVDQVLKEEEKQKMEMFKELMQNNKQGQT